ncbi:TonB-dependent receptor [Asticcacaulis sp. 201]|uniref:TonB-dependent receptor n=1 Tax=Asticcacaulis sp. 201 TaxID=3028787 RepID=UPI002915C7E1|nr:TonB-dependent receptor [Asticcacaulis sp. 201]MDV6333056.1 TonB-dependent receptor [Asticcacaulis sp. 201]
MLYPLPFKGTLRRSTAIATALTVTLSAVPMLAQAQSSDSAQAESGATTEIVVTGIKRSNLKAVASKLNHAGVSDVVSSNEVQALPDITIVEALRRVPGLAVLPTLDNEHPRDESTTPVIRGLGAAYNNVTIDGSPIASPGTPNGSLGSVGRGVRLDLLPSSMISEMVVNKTFTANLDPNAVGGAIDLKTRSAFERGGRPFFTMEAALGGASDVSKPNSQNPIGGRVVTTGSFTFGPEHRYGLVVSANFQTLDSTTDTHMTTDSIHESYYNAAGVLQSGNNLGNGIAVPQQDKYWYVQDRRSRMGLTAKFESKFSDTLYGFVTGGFYQFRDDMQRNENIIDPRNRNTILNQTATSGQYAGGDIEVGFSEQKMTSATALLQSGLDWKIADDATLSVRATASRATYREPILMIKYSTGNINGAPGTAAGTTPSATPNYAITYDTSGLNQSFNIAPSAWYNLSNYKLLYYRPDYKRSATDTIQSVRVDYRKHTDAPGFGYAAGASYTEDKPSYSVYRNDLEPNTSAVLGTLADAIGSVNAPLKYNQSGLNLLTLNWRKAVAQAEVVRAAGGLNTTDQSGFSNQDNFEHVEKTLGLYGLVTYSTDRLKTQFGLHSDSTDQTTVGRVKAAGVWSKLPTSSSYSFILPSALATYKISDNLDIRAAASQTIGRPTYDSYAARSSISFTNASDLGNANATGVSVSVGNPEIKPRLSTNLDLAVNYKLPKATGGLVSLAVFSKDIKDEIFNSASIGYTYQGVTYANAVVTQPVNASSASVKGIEASVIVNSLVWIHPVVKDFGFSANWTALNGEIDVLKSDKSTRTLKRLIGQPDQTRNLTLFYSHDNLEVRVAYNYQGKALRAIVPDISWQDLYWAPREQVDLQASYKVRPGVSVFTQVQNLTHTRLTSLLGPNQNLLKDTYSVPTTFWLGVRFTPVF